MTLVITDEDVKELLSMQECIDAMRVCFTQFAEGIAVSRPRLRYRMPSPKEGYTYSANIHVGAVPAFNTAVVRAGSNVGREISATRRASESPTSNNPGLVILYSLTTGEPLALIHEYYLSGIRVAATSALALSTMAPSVEVVGLLGTGKQARAHLEAFDSLGTVKRVHTFSPNAQHLAEFVDSYEGNMEIVQEPSAEGLAANSEAVCCATNSLVPVLLGRWLRSGQLVISIANTDVNSPAPRSEVDSDVMTMASAIVVNDRESVYSNNQRELLDLLEDGRVPEGIIYELAEVVSGKRRLVLEGDDQFVYYKNNTGMGMQFAAAGGVIYQNALKKGVAREIPTDWLITDLSDAYSKGFFPSP